MKLSVQLARHLRDLHFGGNWTGSCLQDQLQDVSWEEATTKVQDLNTILALVYHIHYYVKVTLPVLRGQPLDAHDKYSFDHPPVHSKSDWDQFLAEVWAQAREFADLIEQLPAEKLWENMADPKYGSYLRNVLGIIEHSHYHLGQIALIKKLVRA